MSLSFRAALIVPLLAISACTTDTPENLPEGKPLLDVVYRNMGRIFSYHADAVLEADGGKATISGDFGVDRVRYTMQRFDGQQMRVIIPGKVAYLSVGADTSWAVDSTGGALAMAQLITRPAGSRLGLAKDHKVVTVGTEQIDTFTTTHLRIEQKDPIDIWVGIDPTAGPVVRRVKMPSPSTPGGTVTITYSDYNKDIVVAPPI